MMNMIKKIYILSLALIILSPKLSYAEEEITWKECVRKAKDRHPDLISAAEKIKQTKADKDITVGAALPQVTAEAESKRARTATRKSEYNTHSYGISGTQLIFDGFQTFADVGSAHKAIRAEMYDYAVTSSNIRLNLKTAFASLLQSQELINITESIAKRRKQNLELVKLRHEAGREHRGSLLTAEANLAQAEFEVAQAKRNLILAQRELLKELGQKTFADISADGNFNIKIIDSKKPDMEYLAGNTPFLKALIEKKEAARYDHQSAQSDFFPKVYLNASYSDTATDIDWPYEKIKNSEKAWAGSISASLPLFEGGARIAELSKTRSQWRQAKADEQSGRDSVLVVLEETWKDFQDAIEEVSVKKKFLEANEERAKISSAQYEIGMVSFDDWVIIEDNLVTSRKDYLKAQENMLVDEAYWIQAIGGTLEYDEK